MNFTLDESVYFSTPSPTIILKSELNPSPINCDTLSQSDFILNSIFPNNDKKSNQKLPSNNNNFSLNSFLNKINNVDNSNNNTSLNSFCEQNKNTKAKSALFANIKYYSNDSLHDANFNFRNDNSNNNKGTANQNSTNFKKIAEILNSKNNLIEKTQKPNNVFNKSIFEYNNNINNNNINNNTTSCSMDIESDSINSDYGNDLIGKKRNNFAMNQIGNYANINTNTNDAIDCYNTGSSNNYFLLKKMKITASKEENKNANNPYFTFSNSQSLQSNNQNLANEMNFDKVETKFFPYESRIPSINNSFYKDVYLPK